MMTSRFHYLKYENAACNTNKHKQTNSPTSHPLLPPSHVPLSVELARSLFLLSVNRGDGGGISSLQTASPIRPCD